MVIVIVDPTWINCAAARIIRVRVRRSALIIGVGLIWRCVGAFERRRTADTDRDYGFRFSGWECHKLYWSASLQRGHGWNSRAAQPQRFFKYSNLALISLAGVTAGLNQHVNVGDAFLTGAR